MGHGHRVGNQGFNGAQVFRQAPQLDVVHQPFAGIQPTLDFKPGHGAKPAGLAAGEFVLREGLEARVAHLFHFRMRFEIFCHRHRVGRLMVHPDGQCFAALQRQPGHLR